ncbi:MULTISPECIES: hypothetical protein [Marinomonas]|uniref:Uncharacterized protein n=1 Tax=Marinomonas arctica TaxID=383750 RepID=A0A7H1JB99_9GAMM|nr:MULTISPECIES: hypothetical protein [Marinomonas]MCS7485470.1 hypothetical protein [Marinomonas sp. BSi20414]QNT07765.1 hypothetical protein IBG28_09285 [Marinomonas arctica]GGN25350.1 hypothetical protein GCM10011350_15030 [Marinomonas arctica]
MNRNAKKKRDKAQEKHIEEARTGQHDHDRERTEKFASLAKAKSESRTEPVHHVVITTNPASHGLKINQTINPADPNTNIVAKDITGSGSQGRQTSYELSADPVKGSHGRDRAAQFHVHWSDGPGKRAEASHQKVSANGETRYRALSVDSRKALEERTRATGYDDTEKRAVKASK